MLVVKTTDIFRIIPYNEIEIKPKALKMTNSTIINDKMYSLKNTGMLLLYLTIRYIYVRVK